MSGDVCKELSSGVAILIYGERVRNPTWENVYCALTYRIYDVITLVTFLYVSKGVRFGFH